jgi:hypothetical protein
MKGARSAKGSADFVTTNRFPKWCTTIKAALEASRSRRSDWHKADMARVSFSSWSCAEQSGSRMMTSAFRAAGVGEEVVQPGGSAEQVTYQIAERTRAIGFGGIGALHKLVYKMRLDKAINKNVVLLQRHVPYWESDHVLNLAYNVLAGGTCLEDIERQRKFVIVTRIISAKSPAIDRRAKEKKDKLQNLLWVPVFWPFHGGGKFPLK